MAITYVVCEAVMSSMQPGTSTEQGGARPAPAPWPGLEQGGFRPGKKVQKTSNIRPEPTPWSALATGLDQPWSCPGQGVTLTHAAKCNSKHHDSNDAAGHAAAFSNRGRI